MLLSSLLSVPFLAARHVLTNPLSPGVLSGHVVSSTHGWWLLLLLCWFSWCFLYSYKKTQETFSQAGQKTSAALSTVGSAISRKLGDMR